MFLKSVFSKRDVEHVLEERVLEQHAVVDVAVASYPPNQQRYFRLLMPTYVTSQDEPSEGRRDSSE